MEDFRHLRESAGLVRYMLESLIDCSKVLKLLMGSPTCHLCQDSSGGHADHDHNHVCAR